jgi:hypothetical protein
MPPCVERQEHSRGKQRDVHRRVATGAEKAAHFEGGVGARQADERAVGWLTKSGDTK